ncbi:type II toxin-antitoxin system RelE/ParE family toxin [Fibrella forsythiae]|uniref:Type II toxin-antitoxin system RelE/ParE family toxin n=1 Tax=Fibrella forsythiae TaxID=2817061 RepID=A0ABS3JE69_9BACT|nr:type II toxin-antitoxin system RelE/ParE family toxin [Fibrella forsythiae]MBO0947743.1 type II toxin-antitoxin system RelE/ParE family toxin [Fibrella forsythiae]
MSIEVIPILPFQRQAKRLIKKYPSLKKEILQLIERLQTEPTQGTSLGNDCYKIRLAIASKSKGKAGGARVITCVYSADSEVYLLSIYDKSERSSLNDSELKELISWIQEMK